MRGSGRLIVACVCVCVCVHVCFCNGRLLRALSAALCGGSLPYMFVNRKESNRRSSFILSTPPLDLRPTFCPSPPLLSPSRPLLTNGSPR